MVNSPQKTSLHPQGAMHSWQLQLLEPSFRISQCLGPCPSTARRTHSSSSPALTAPPPCRHTGFTNPVFSCWSTPKLLSKPLALFSGDENNWAKQHVSCQVGSRPWSGPSLPEPDTHKPVWMGPGREHHLAPQQSTMVSTRLCRKHMEKAGIHTLIQLS